MTPHTAKHIEALPTVAALLGASLQDAIKGPRFATIDEAVAEAVAGQVVYVLPGTHNISPITLPASVSLRGVDTQRCVLQRLAVTADTDLLTMGISSRVEQITLNLTSAEHHALRGIVFPSTTTETAKVRTAVCNVNNSGASDGGTSDVYGVHFDGTGQPDRNVDAVRATTITTRSAGLGNKRAAMLDTACKAYMRDVNLGIFKSGAGVGSYIGAEVNHASGVLSMLIGRIAASAGLPDWSQTAGMLEMGDVDPANFNANGLGFTQTLRHGKLIWGDDGNVPSGTRYMRFGTGASSTAEASILAGKPMLGIGIEVSAQTAGGAGKNAVFTLRKNGADTPVTVTLSGTNLTATAQNLSTTFAATDRISMKIVNDAGSALADVQVSVNGY